MDDITRLDLPLGDGQFTIISYLDQASEPCAQGNLFGVNRKLTLKENIVKRATKLTGMRNMRKTLPATCNKNRARVVGNAHSSHGMRRACRPNKKKPSKDTHFKNSHVESSSSEAFQDSYIRYALSAR